MSMLAGVLEDAERDGAADAPTLGATLRFARAYAGGERPVTDAEGLFLLEDLKVAGLSTSRLRAVRAALRADNEALGRAVARGGAVSGGGAAEARSGVGDAVGGETPSGGRGSLWAPRSLQSDVVKWRALEDELEGMARFVQGEIRRAGGELPECRVCVAVPNLRWAHLAQRALEHRRFTVSRTQLGYALGGDPRSLDRCPELAAFDRLALLACPDDALALRVWYGAGQPDLGAHAWVGALAGMPVQGVAGRGMLDCLLDRGDDSLDAGLLARLREARAFIEAKSCLRGYSLAHAVGVEGLPAFAPLMELLDAGDDAPALFARACRLLCGPVFAVNPHAVHVATYDALAELAGAGVAYDLVVALAAVEGLVPGDGHALLGTLGAARGRLVISHFTQLPVPLAHKAGLPVARTRQEQGEQVALVRPSAALAALGDDLPPTQDGQAFVELSEL